MKHYTTLQELNDIQTALRIHQDLFEAGIYAFLEYANSETGEMVICIRVRKSDLPQAHDLATAA